jgi:tetratricopeptide (TPR) repeat protein
MTGRDAMRPPDSAATLIGRQRESAVVAAFIACTVGARALVLEGEPGIGKSTLWGAGVALALGRQDTVLWARATQAEASMSYAGLGDLLEPVADRLAGLSARQQVALDVALLRRTPDAVPPSEREIGLALLAALRILALESPITLALDDLQWLDRASAEVLSYALRRLTTEPIRVLLARRTEDPDSLSASASPSAVTVLEATVALSVQVVRVGPLADEDVALLIRDRLVAPVPSAVTRRLTAAARGNPFWAIELAAATTATSKLAMHDEQVEIAVPAALDVLLAARLARLPDGARIALLVVTTLSRPSWAAVTRTLRGLVSDPDTAIDDAVAAGALTESSGRLAPTHPLLGTAALHSLTATRRRLLHRRLADASVEPEERARHLALASTGEPDAEIAASLDIGVSSARSRGASHAAAELAGLAVEFTARDEAAELLRRRLDAAELSFAAGDLDRAYALANDVFASGTPPDVWPRLLPLLIEVTYWVRGQAAAQAVLRTVLKASDGDRRRRAVALACAADVGDGTGRDRAELAEESIALFDFLGDSDPGVLSTALVYLAEARLDAGHGVDRDLLQRAQTAENQKPRTGSHWIPVLNRVASIRAYQLKSVDDLDGARVGLLQALSTARSEGDDTSLPAVLGHLALTEYWAGNYDDALKAAQDGLLHAAQTGGVAPATLYAAHALLAVVTGDPDTARAVITAQLRVKSDTVASKRTLVYRHVLGLAALLEGDMRLALQHLDAAWKIATELGIAEPGRRQRLEGDLGEALVACGQLDRADSLADEQITLGERTGRPTVVGRPAGEYVAWQWLPAQNSRKLPLPSITRSRLTAAHPYRLSSHAATSH